MMKRTLRLLLCLLLAGKGSVAQIYTPDAGQILLKLRKLNTVGSVLYIAAHPDDENTRLLAYLANDRLLRTGYLSLTRGDGGQNLIGKEQGEPLGLIRTQELLAARRIDGAEQFFTRANDFGFSKNPSETFRIWNENIILEDVVRTIRKFKPDVIICRFPTTGEGGHGHHTASAFVALEAFKEAGDSTSLPEQLAYTEVWQPKRIFWNTFNFGGLNTTSEDQVKIDVGGFNPLLGRSYGELAADSRSMHKSQGFGSARGRGSSFEYFKQLGGDTAHKDLFEGITLSWLRFPGGAAVKKSIDQCIAHFNPQHPEASLPELVAIHKQLLQLGETDPQLKYWKHQKIAEAEQLLLICAGVWVEATTADFSGIPGRETAVTAQVLKRNNSDVQLRQISFNGWFDTTTALSLKDNELYSFRHAVRLPEDMSYSNPYWLNEPHSAGLYSVHDPAMIGRPENSAAMTVTYSLVVKGVPLTVQRGVSYKYTDPVKGEVYRPFEVLPPATVNIQEPVYVFSGRKPKKVQVIVRANDNNVKGLLRLRTPAGWTVSMADSAFSLAAKGDEQIMEAEVAPEENKLYTNTTDVVTAELVVGGKTYGKSIRRMEYDHIPYQFILSDAKAALVSIDLKKDGRNIGYIPGAGDEVAACLKQVGYKVTILDDEQLTNSDLTRFDAIVTGVRLYNTNSRMQVHYNKLMDYVKNGGNLVVQYNTNNRIGPVQAKIGPYPFTISRDRVTDEQAEVSIIDTAHPALNFPNKITGSDFKGWVQERGIYFAAERDKQYVSVLSMHDPEEKPMDGSLIVARYGKGNFVYTGLAFFRELPAGIPGAYRLFVNLLSLPRETAK